jgi:hypothetical protein
MYRGGGFYGGFRFGFPPFMFWGFRPFPMKEEYLRMLEEYKRDLEAELSRVTREIDDLKRE